MIKVNVQLKENSQPIEYTNVIDVYTKGPLLCVYLRLDGKGVVHKYPIADIFRIVQEYGYSGRGGQITLTELEKWRKENFVVDPDDERVILACKCPFGGVGIEMRDSDLCCANCGHVYLGKV